MQEKEMVEDSSFSQKNVNLKSFLSVFIILIVIISGYYFFWRSVSVKTKNVMSEKLQNFEYSSIKTKGFPFYKNIEVNDLKILSKTALMTKNSMLVKKMSISSFIFSKKFKIEFGDINVFDAENNTSYTLTYNDIPDIYFILYSDGSLKNFSYSDIGYRVINTDNKTLYTAGNSKLQLQSVKNDNVTDYSITGELQDMQNLSIIDNKDKIVQNNEPSIYSLKFGISSSITKEEDEITNSIIKITNLSLISNKNDLINLTANINKDKDNPYSYGEIKITLNDYEKLLNDYRANIDKTFVSATENKEITEAEKIEYSSLLDQIFIVTKETIKKNPDTKDKTGIVLITKDKAVNDYMINGESLFTIIKSVTK